MEKVFVLILVGKIIAGEYGRERQRFFSGISLRLVKKKPPYDSQKWGL